MYNNRTLFPSRRQSKSAAKIIKKLTNEHSVFQGTRFRLMFCYGRKHVKKLHKTNELQVEADLHSQHFRLSNSFFRYSRLMIWSKKIFDGETNWILSDRLHDILLKNLEREKNEFESRKCCECRSALTCMNFWKNLENSPVLTGYKSRCFSAK